MTEEEKINQEEEEILNNKEQEVQSQDETTSDSPAVDGSPVDETTADGTRATDATDSPAVDGSPVDDTPDDQDPLEKAQAEIADLKNQLLYKVAEFDNYRKRTLKEKAELILNGGEKAVSAILPVIDDMERAIDNGAKTDDPEVLREGMDLIYHKFIKALESLGVKKIETENADFNTDVHEAVAMVPGMGDDKKGKVIDCLQTGYQLNDKVIRHAKVAVGQ